MIKKIMIPGGGPNILYTVGALKELLERKIWILDNIEEIWGTSAGSMIGLAIIFNIDLNVISNYLIERPWNKLVPKPSILFQNIYNTGAVDKNTLIKILKPFYQLSDNHINITFMELFDKYKIAFHVYVTNFTTCNEEIFSHKTHPDVLVIDAIYMSSTIPGIFKPIEYKGNLYIDGFFSSPYPKCLHVFNYEDKKHTLSFNNCDNYIDIHPKASNESINDSYNIYKMLTTIIIKLINKYFNKQHQIVENEVRLNIPKESLLVLWHNFLHNKSYRINCVRHGEKVGYIFCQRKLINEEIKNYTFEQTSKNNPLTH